MAEDRAKRPRKKRDGAEEETAAASGGGKKTIIIVAAVAAVMLGVGAGAGFFIAGMVAPDPATEAAEDVAESEEEEVPKEDRHNIYASVGKILAMVDDDGATRYIQAEIDIVSYEKAVIDAAQHDMPAIRNRLLLLYGSQQFDEVRTTEGREALRSATVDAVNEVLGTTTKNGIHDAFFTSFVIQ